MPKSRRLKYKEDYDIINAGLRRVVKKYLVLKDKSRGCYPEIEELIDRGLTLLGFFSAINDKLFTELFLGIGLSEEDIECLITPDLPIEEEE